MLGTAISSGAVNFKNGGHITLVGSGNDITLGVESGYSIPSDTKQGQWDTSYAHATDANRLTTAQASGFYKFATTAEGHIKSVTAVTASDLTSLIGSTTYAPYNSAGYLPLSGGTMTGAITGTTIYSGTLQPRNLFINHPSDTFGASAVRGCITYNQTGIPATCATPASRGLGIYITASATADYSRLVLTALNGIYLDGTVKINNNTAWHAGNDGAGSGLDADLLDGYEASALVKYDAGAAEQAIKSSISSLSKGVINLWRNSGDHYTFLGFSNGTTETYLGGIGFKSQSDHNLYRKDGGNYYKIWDENNDGSDSGLDADKLDGLQGSSYARNAYVYIGATGSTQKYYKIANALNGVNFPRTFVLSSRSYETYHIIYGISDGTKEVKVHQLDNRYTKVKGFAYSGDDLYVWLNAYCIMYHKPTSSLCKEERHRLV